MAVQCDKIALPNYPQSPQTPHEIRLWSEIVCRGGYQEYDLLAGTGMHFSKYIGAGYGFSLIENITMLFMVLSAEICPLVSDYPQTPKR